MQGMVGHAVVGWGGAFHAGVMWVKTGYGGWIKVGWVGHAGVGLGGNTLSVDMRLYGCFT